MKESVALISQSISGCSILTNIYLIYVYFACPVKAINSYKYFLLITAIQDIIYAACMLLLVPVTIADDFAFVFLAIGPLRYREVGQVLIVIFALSFFTSLLIVANSFIYRYIQVCRAHLFARYSSLHVVAIVLFINIAIITNYLTIVYVVFWPNPTTIEQLSGEVLSMTGLNSSECAQFGASLTHGLLEPLHFGLFAELLLLMSVLGGITIYSAIRIRCTLVKSTFSENLRKMHWKMYTLLLLQTASPLLFLHTPCFVGFLYLFTGFQSTIISLNIITVLFALFPFFSPIIVIGFLGEYRHYTLAIMRYYKKSSKRRKRVQTKFVLASDVRTTTMS